MISRFYSLVFFLMFLCMGSFAFSYEENEKILNVGVSADYPPFEFIENEKIVGFDIDLANKKIERDKILDIIESEPKQFQLVLYSIFELTKASKGEGLERFYTGDVYNLYQDVCNRTKTDSLTQRRVSDILAEVDMLGLINAKVISKGRHGRTREIKLSIPNNLFDRAEAILVDSLGL